MLLGVTKNTPSVCRRYKKLAADWNRDASFSVRNNKKEEFTHFLHKLRGTKKKFHLYIGVSI
jgi:hypothetical protein